MKLPYVYLQFPQFCFSLKMKGKDAEAWFVIVGRGQGQINEILFDEQFREEGMLHGGPKLAFAPV